MTSYLSNKIRIVSFLSMLLVVILHANVMDLSIGLSRYIQETLTEEITRIAVPLFFLISGFLFFIHCDGSNIFFKEKIVRRLRSLVVPYLILTIIGGITWAFAKKEESFLITIVESVFICPKVFYQLWFMHDLIIMSFLSPFFYWLFKKVPYIWILVCLVWIMGHYWSLLNILYYESLFFWGMGGIIALHLPTLAEYNFEKRKSLIIGLFVVWILMSLAITYTGRPYYIHGISLIIGIYVIWGSYDILYPFVKHHPKILNISAYTFFLFLFHEPVLTGYKKFIFLILKWNQLASLAIYVISPILTIVSVLLVGKYMKSKIPSFYYIITGNRYNKR